MKLLTITSKPLKTNRIESKGLITIPAAYGISKSRSNFAILQLIPFKNLSMRLKPGLLLVIASRYKNNISRHWNSSLEPYNLTHKTHMHIPYAGMSTSTMKILTKQKEPLNKL